MSGYLSPEAMATASAVVGAVITQAGNWLLRAKRENADASRIAAEGRKIDAEAQATIAAEWQKMVAELRREIHARDEHCEAKLADLQRQIDKMRAGQIARDKIIVALVHRREMDEEARVLLMEIAPAAQRKTDFKPGNAE